MDEIVDRDACQRGFVCGGEGDGAGASCVKVFQPPPTLLSRVHRSAHPCRCRPPGAIFHDEQGFGFKVGKIVC